ncbi:glycoside hydrolase domain-containing protein [Streptomyces sp. NPDC003697]
MIRTPVSRSTPGPTEEYVISPSPSPSPRPRTRRHALRALTALTACAAVGAGLPAAARASAGDTRTVVYRGHTFTVPADWAVVDLTRHPAACVRFDRHAVYLGTPGERQDCPTRLTGRTEALWVQPGSTTAKTAAVTENRTARVYRATAEGIAVTAPYGADREEVRQVLRSAGLPVTAARAEKPAVAPAALTVPADATSYRGRGFDTCTAPSQTAMDAWRKSSPYRAIGIYIGGVNRACGQAKLNAQWVQKQYTNGWRFFPLYVGPQPSTGAGSCRNDCAAITSPAPQGRAAAEDAVAQAAALGLGRGTVIYNDLEQYTRGTLTARVLGYLEAWTKRLHELGYRSGAYGGVSSLVADLVEKRKSTTLPDVLHFARWNDQATTADPAVPASLWANHQRIHQYAGNRTETYGGVTIGVDRDQLDVGTPGK